MDADQVRLKSIVCIFRDAVDELLKTFSVNDPKATDHDGCIAFSQVLYANKNVLKSMDSASYDISSLYDDNGQIKSRIDTSQLDFTLIHEFLLRINSFPTSRKKSSRLQCREADHSGRCCINCFHQCSQCQNVYCKGSIKIKNTCQYQSCSHCSISSSDCTNASKVCCKSCKICTCCGLNKPLEMQCELLKLNEAIKDARNLRNTLAHYDLFDNISMKNLTRFNHCNTMESLYEHLQTTTLTNIINYLRSKYSMTQEEYDEFLKKFKDVTENFTTKQLYDIYKLQKVEMDSLNEKVEEVSKDLAKVKDEIKKQDGDKNVKIQLVYVDQIPATNYLISIDGLPEDTLFSRVQLEVEKELWKDTYFEKFHSDGVSFLLFSKKSEPLKENVKFKITCNADIFMVEKKINLEDYRHVVSFDHKFGAVFHPSVTGNDIASVRTFWNQLEKQNCVVKRKVLTSNRLIAHTQMDWYRACFEYCERHYNILKEAVKVPEYDHGNVIENEATLLKKWFDDDSIRGLVVNSFDVQEYYKFIGFAVPKELNNIFQSDCINSILLYHLDDKILLLINEVSGLEVENLSVVTTTCCKNAQLLVLSLGDILFESDIVFLSLIVVGEQIRPVDPVSSLLCKECRKCKLILNKKDWQNKRKWWRNDIRRLASNFKGEGNNGDLLNMETPSLSLISRILGYMSTKDTGLPILSNYIPDILRLMLTRQQRCIFESKEKCFIVFGSFGSGKSIIGQQKLCKVLKNSEIPVIVFYLCDANYSLYVHVY